MNDTEIVIAAKDGNGDWFQHFQEIVEGVGIFKQFEEDRLPITFDLIEGRSFVTVSWKSEKLPRAIKVWLETITHPRNCQFCDKLRQKALSEPSTSSSH